MNKLLAILWSIILLGAVYISINMFKPDSALEQQIQYEELVRQEELNNIFNQKDTEDVTENEEEEEKAKVSSNKEENNISNNQTFSSYIELGNYYLESGDYNNASLQFEKASQLNPNSSSTLSLLGYAYSKDNETEKAKSTYQNAFNLNSDDPTIQIGLVKANIDIRSLEEAESLITKMDQGSPEVLYYRAILKILKNENEGAKEIFEEVAKLENSPEELKEKAEIFLDAYENFEVFTDSDPIFLDALLAKALGQADEFQAGIIVALDIINNKNNYRDAWIVLGYNYLAVEKARDAIDALEKAEDLSPEKPEILFYLGLAHFANNDSDKAISYLEKSYKNGFEPKDEINLKLGDIYLMKENYDKAAFRYEKVLTQNTSNIDVFVRAIWLNIDKTNNPQKALSLAQKAAEEFPESAMAYNLLGWAQLANKDYQSAEKSLMASLNLNPTLDAANLNFGLLYEKQGKTILAKEFYKKAYLLGRGNSIARRAAINYNNLTQTDFNQYYQVDIAAP